MTHSKKRMGLFLVIFCSLFGACIWAQNLSNSGVAPVDPENVQKLLLGLRRANTEEAEKFTITDSILVFDTYGQQFEGPTLEQVIALGVPHEFYVNALGEAEICILQISPNSNSNSDVGAVGGISSAHSMNRWSDAATVLSDAWMGQELPDFSLADIQNKKVSSKKLKGKVVVMHFWSARSRICRSELPQLNALVERFKNQKDITFISLAIDPKTYLEQVVSKQKFTFQLIPNAGTVAMDGFGVGPVPTFMIADRSGTIRHVSRGYAPGNVQQLAHQLNRIVGIDTQPPLLN